MYAKIREKRELNTVRKLIAGRYCFKQILPTIFDDVCKELYDKGVWEEDTLQAVWYDFLPQVVMEVSNKADKSKDVESIVAGRMNNAKGVVYALVVIDVSIMIIHFIIL